MKFTVSDNAFVFVVAVPCGGAFSPTGFRAHAQLSNVDISSAPVFRKSVDT
jgi:hypothetical protein